MDCIHLFLTSEVVQEGNSFIVSATFLTTGHNLVETSGCCFLTYLIHIVFLCTSLFYKLLNYFALKSCQFVTLVVIKGCTFWKKELNDRL